jgi:ankyrin repeat protein
MDNIWGAAKAGDVGEVERLVGQDPNLLNARAALGVTPLIVASASGHVEVVRWLLDQGAAIDVRAENDVTALVSAIFSYRPAVIRLLLERGGDPTIANSEGWTPLACASWQGRLEIVRLLLAHPSATTIIDHGDAHNQTALHYACLRGAGGVARALLESGANPTVANHAGVTPLDVAKYHKPHGLTRVSGVPRTAARRAAGSVWRRSR